MTAGQEARPQSSGSGANHQSPWRVVLGRQAAKELKLLANDPQRRRLEAAIRDLPKVIRDPSKVRKVKGTHKQDPRFRIRVGD